MEIVSFLQTKMAQAYAEQIWAVSILGIYYGFIITKGDLLIKALHPKIINFSIRLFSFMGVFFIIGRHLIYEHYNGYLTEILKRSGHRALFELTVLEMAGQVVVNYSGVIIYSGVILLLACAANFSLKNSEGQKPPINNLQ